MKRVMKIEVRKHKGDTYKNIRGEVTKVEWYYTLAIRRFGFWCHLRLFFTGATRWKRRADMRRILQDKKVLFSYSPSRYATWFESENDAIYIKHDIIQNPDKYIKRQY